MTWYMEEVHLSDQMYFSNQVDRRSKFRFYLRIFFDALDTGVLNSTIIYEKLDSVFGTSTMDCHFSLICSMIWKIFKLEKNCPNTSTFKKFLRREFWDCWLFAWVCFYSCLLYSLFFPRRFLIVHLSAITPAMLIYTSLNNK